MRVCFVLPHAGRSGGVDVVAGHARRLARDHGVDADVVTVGELPRRRGYDLAVATWWETAGALWELEAERRVLFLQSFEQRFYGPHAPFERLGAEAVLALPIDFLAVAPWLRETLLELRPGASCRVVPNGIDKEVFSREREVRREGPLRVLVEGQATLPFKGVREAVAAVRAMREPAHCTVVALDPESLEGLDADSVVGGLDAAGMARVYADNDVLVKLSRVEGLGMAPVEGFHGGLPCVITPYTGHEEYAEHGVNGAIVGFDDLPGTAGWLDRLARDRDLLARLSAGALATAARWPSAERSSELLAAALRDVLDSPAPGTDVPLLLRTLALHAELGRGRLERGSEHALAAAQAHVRELSASRDECGEMLDEARAELARIRGGRAFRAAAAAKRAARRIARR